MHSPPVCDTDHHTLCLSNISLQPPLAEGEKWTFTFPVAISALHPLHSAHARILLLCLFSPHSVMSIQYLQLIISNKFLLSTLLFLHFFPPTISQINVLQMSSRFYHQTMETIYKLVSDSNNEWGFEPLLPIPHPQPFLDPSPFPQEAPRQELCLFFHNHFPPVLILWLLLVLMGSTLVLQS